MARVSLSVVRGPNGVVVYRGPSQIDGRPIVAVATGLARPSTNAKTGDMVQVWVLVDGIKPHEAVFDGRDVSVCGDCPHRYIDGAGSCYVNPLHGPDAVMRAVASGTYTAVPLVQAAELVRGRKVRLGAYGDPAAVPLEVWDALLEHADGWSGYTHQWRRAIARGLSRYCMASVETPRQQRHAISRGWRTFRIRADGDDALLAGEIVCPASDEAGKRRTCETCGACNGGSPPRASVAIIAHGPTWKRVRLTRMVKALKAKRRLRFQPA